jgi:hypothetical protein
MAPEGIYFTAHLGADAALIRFPNSKMGIFNDEIDLMSTVQITERRRQ